MYYFKRTEYEKNNKKNRPHSTLHSVIYHEKPFCFHLHFHGIFRIVWSLTGLRADWLQPTKLCLWKTHVSFNPFWDRKF